jgi:prephenate dehydratase
MLCKHSFNRYISRSANAGRKLATLGPSRTSSYAAARHFAQDYPADIALFPTYEEAADAVRAAPGESALIVANAYANINRFYISDVLHPIGAFFKDTPAYVVAARDDTALDGREITIASHAAPLHLIAHLAARPNVTIRDASSTHRAAELVVEDKAQACLTTQVAADLLGLRTLDVALLTIPMLWTIFACKDN